MVGDKGASKTKREECNSKIIIVVVEFCIFTWRRYVSFEFLNGTCSSFFAKENMTSLKEDRLLLMA
jgi:hypothetical protein